MLWAEELNIVEALIYGDEGQFLSSDNDIATCQDMARYVR